jgi:hypothetical protein
MIVQLLACFFLAGIVLDHFLPPPAQASALANAGGSSHNQPFNNERCPKLP